MSYEMLQDKTKKHQDNLILLCFSGQWINLVPHDIIVSTIRILTLLNVPNNSATLPI